MKANRRVDTRPEVALRSALHRMGYRYRKDVPLVVGGRKCRPDIVFARKRVAVFVDGCFWHCCPLHGHQPRVNTGYWEKKLRRNVERDHLDSEALAEEGWKVVRIWEHVPLDDAVSLVIEAVDSRELTK
jgi:DNA mismatch endonuclease (patch repair protein)